MGSTNSTFQTNRKLVGILFFDGYCVLCNRWVDFLLRVLSIRSAKSAHFSFQIASLQGSTAKKIFEELGRKDFITPPLKTIVFYQKLESSLANKLKSRTETQIFTESEALFKIVSLLGFPWSVLTVFRIVPRFMLDFFYRCIANHRYTWFGKRSACRVPTAEERRFLLD